MLSNLSIIANQISSGKKNVTAFLFLISVFYFLPIDVIGQGNLLVTPRRVVFEGNTRSIDLNLANIGQDTATYNISLIQMRMNEDGTFETITTPEKDQRFANKNIRYFPRSVILPPEEAQVVKVQLNRANNLEPGEYRSHFYFRAEPKSVALGEEPSEDNTTAAIDTTSILVQIIPIFGITMPVIIRVGQSDTEVTLSDIDLDMASDSTWVLKLKINRSGNFSVYGDLMADHLSTTGEVTRVGRANGISVYTPNSFRWFELKLNKIEGIDFNSGELKILYSARSDVKRKKYAEAILKLK